MPTAAKLMAAIIFAITGYLTADAVRALLPESAPAKQLTVWSVVIPVNCGWRVIGKYVPRGGYAQRLNAGVYAMAVAVFFTVGACAVAEMIERSMDKQYSGPVEAILNMFGILLELGQLLLHPAPLAIMAVGAVSAGVLGLWSHRKWG